MRRPDDPSGTRVDASRRALLRASLGAGALAGGVAAPLLAPGRTDAALDAVSRWNDRVQAALFDPTRAVPTHRFDEVASPFPYNGFYAPSLAPRLDAATWRLAVGGRVERPLALSVGDLRCLPARDEATRLICIEGWSAIGRWAGPTLADVLAAAGADARARFVALHCADGYWTSIDMASALHPQTLVALDFLGRPLPTSLGAPARLRIPVKLGFKNAKFVERVEVTDEPVGGYWEDQGYGWFAGL